MISLTINHTSWYEVVYDSGILLFGIAAGIIFGLFLLLRHIHTGFTYLRVVSKSRPIGDDDLWVAFAWAGRKHRREFMREYERSLRRPTLRLVDDRPDEDTEASRTG